MKIDTIFIFSAITMTGLCLFAIGSGMARPCIQALGGDQFVLPQQESKLFLYFALHNMVVQCGQIVGMVVSPLLKLQVQCFNENDCYFLSFGVESICMCLSYSKNGTQIMR